MDQSSQEVIFVKSLRAAAAATAGTSVSKDVVMPEAEDGERRAKIESLRGQIASGEYAADALELSKRILDDHLAG